MQRGAAGLRKGRPITVLNWICCVRLIRRAQVAV
jgi:hypothetical protein